MDSERINKTEQEIQKILPAKPEYVVTTSEYRDVRERLISRDDKAAKIGRRQRTQNRPTKRQSARARRATAPRSTMGPIADDYEPPCGLPDDRPTLKFAGTIFDNFEGVAYPNSPLDSRRLS
jgi:beta-barrel assembly-enhancing protease